MASEEYFFPTIHIELRVVMREHNRTPLLRQGRVKALNDAKYDISDTFTVCHILRVEEDRFHVLGTIKEIGGFHVAMTETKRLLANLLLNTVESKLSWQEVKTCLQRISKTGNPSGQVLSKRA